MPVSASKDTKSGHFSCRFSTFLFWYCASAHQNFEVPCSYLSFAALYALSLIPPGVASVPRHSDNGFWDTSSLSSLHFPFLSPPSSAFLCSLHNPNLLLQAEQFFLKHNDSGAWVQDSAFLLRNTRNVPWFLVSWLPHRSSCRFVVSGKPLSSVGGPKLGARKALRSSSETGQWGWVPGELVTTPFVWPWLMTTPRRGLRLPPLSSPHPLSPPPPLFFEEKSSSRSYGSCVE